MPYFILDLSAAAPIRGGSTLNNDGTGLPASGSSYLPRLPVLSDSGMLRLSSPVTAAGPRRLFTVFPFWGCKPPIIGLLFNSNDSCCQALFCPFLGLIYGNLWESEARITKNPGPWREQATGKEVTIPCPIVWMSLFL